MPPLFYFDTYANISVQAIVQCSNVVVPVLFILHAFKNRLPVLNLQTLITAVNTTMLFAAMLFFALNLVYAFVAWYSATEYWQFMWNPLMLIGVAGILIFPQLFWFKKFRRSIVCGFIVAGYNIILYILTWQPTPEPEPDGMLLIHLYIITFSRCLFICSLYRAFTGLPANVRTGEKHSLTQYRNFSTRG